jgi:hypothetical protein
MQEIDKGISAYWHYSRLLLTHFLDLTVYTVPLGYHYLIRTMVTNWVKVRPAGTFNGQSLEFQLYRSSRGSWGIHSNPIPGDLFSSPSGRLDVTRDGATQSTTCATIGSLKRLNWILQSKESLQIHVTGQNTTNPPWCDTIIQGYLIPNEKLGMWGKA